MASYILKASVQLNSTAAHPSTWVRSDILNVLEPDEELHTIMYEPIGELTFEITALLTANNDPKTWVADLLNSTLEKDESLLGIESTLVPDEEVQTKHEEIVSKIISMKLG